MPHAALPRLSALWRTLALLLPTAAFAQATDSSLISSKPLAPHPYPQGATMFVSLPAESTGLKSENNYADPRMRGELYQEFETSSIGTGVAIGDFDGDGRPDIYVVSKTEGCRLFKNLGNYKFVDVTEKAGVGATPGVWNEGATFVDINNSGRLDLYVCRTNAPNLLYINQGDGTFKEMAHAYGLDVVDASVMAAFCDYDRDGLLDLYIATNILNMTTHPNGQRGFLFHHNHDGTFTNVTDKAGILGESQSHSATWWDFDGDGWPDLYVANDYGYTNPDRLYHNNRDGTFTDVLSQVAPHTSFSSMGADSGDVNNTGRIDFLVADMAATTHFKDHHSIADARGKTDARTADYPTLKYHQNALLLNTGTGRMLEAAMLEGIAATDWTWSLRFEDYDNDGHLDLFVTNGFPRDPGVDTVVKTMSAESATERVRIMYASPMLAETHLGLRNTGDCHFENVSHAWGLDQKGVSFGTATGDLSGDGNVDIVYTNYHGGVTLMRNDCATGHVVNIDLRGTASNRYGVGAQVRVESALGVQTRELVLARGYMSNSEPMLHFGLGADTLVRRMVVTWPSGRTETFENLAVDRRYTITEPNEGTGSPPPAPPAAFVEVGRERGFALISREDEIDETYVQRLLPERLNPRGPALAVGPVFGSGRDDVVVGGTTLDPVRLLRAGPNGSFTPAALPVPANAAAADDGPLLLFDAAGTGAMDLLVTKGGNALAADSPEFQPQLLLNDGHGAFHAAASAALPALPYDVGAVAAADFDHTGRLGVFIGSRLQPGQYPRTPPSALLANRGGRFEDITDAFAPGLREVGLVTSALWTDVDGDGWPDLLVATEWGPVHYFHNRQGQGLEDWTEKAGLAAGGTGWWTSIAAADLNGDGRMDYVVGNQGLNSQYHADPAHPALLYAGDFRGNGRSEIIEAYYEGDTLYPWRSRRTLGAVLPALLKRFPNADAYARATLPEILGQAKLDKATRLAATELRSGVFLSQPDGTYKFEPLARLAQISPLQGMLAGDFEGRGRPEVFALQNCFATIPAVARQDGGLGQLLRGDGRGHLAPVPPLESGLVVADDAKALAVVDLAEDGWPGFLVTRNNGTTLAFQHGSREGRRPLRISLHGAPGNPTAVGARVTVTFKDGTAETNEVYAGSGYYSQSTAALFFGYPEDNPPARLKVTWPRGQVTEQALAGGTPELDLTQP